MKPVSHAMRVAALAIVAASLASCATPETRVRNGLIEAGLSRPMASCMAARMVERLSLLQLRRLDRLSTLLYGKW